MDVLALFGWRTCRETPFKNSFSSASLPTRRSRAAMRASYSASTSAAAVWLSSPPASNLATQILIRLRPIPWRLARACSDSPPRNSWTTWRLNSIECVRCLAMGFHLESPVQLADSHLPHLSTPRGALQSLVSIRAPLSLPRYHSGNGAELVPICDAQIAIRRGGGTTGAMPLLIKPLLFLIAFGPMAVLFASVVGLAGWLLTMCVRAIAWLRPRNSADVPRLHLRPSP